MDYMASLKKTLFTLTDLAKKRNKSAEYLARLCRLPKTDPRHIAAEKINPRLWVITDPKIIQELSK
jgi:uncharacterized protein (DUF1015 family)